jgi:hypothetical protein
MIGPSVHHVGLLDTWGLRSVAIATAVRVGCFIKAWEMAGMTYETFELRFEGCDHTRTIPLLHNQNSTECFVCHTELCNVPAVGKSPEHINGQKQFPAMNRVVCGSFGSQIIGGTTDGHW